MPDGDERPAGWTVATTETLPSDAVRARLVAAYRDHEDELRRFLVGVLGEPEAAADVLQTTLAKSLTHGEAVAAETFKGWLFQVAYREALALRRRERTGEEVRRRLAGTIAQAAEVDAPLIRNETAAEVRKALEQIPEEQRRVILARIYEDKTFAAIAEEFALPLGTVLTRMRRGLERLRTLLQGARPGD